MEERATDLPLEGDLSEFPTMAFEKGEYTKDRDVNGDKTPGEENISGWSTPVDDTPTPSSMHPGILVRSDSQVMQFKKETKTNWSKYPKKGYKTTTKYFYEEIDSHWTAALIVVCFFVSGIVDSVSFQTFSVFTSLQTGTFTDIQVFR